MGYIQYIGSLGAVAKMQLSHEFLAFFCKPISYLLGLAGASNYHDDRVFMSYIASGRSMSIHAKNWVSLCCR